MCAHSSAPFVRVHTLLELGLSTHLLAPNEQALMFAQKSKISAGQYASIFKVHINARDTKAARGSTPAGARTPGQAGQPRE